jgi:hypothetical protein
MRVEGKAIVNLQSVNVCNQRNAGAASGKFEPDSAAALVARMLRAKRSPPAAPHFDPYESWRYLDIGNDMRIAERACSAGAGPQATTLDKPKPFG